jgi:hypothetical protein
MAADPAGAVCTIMEMEGDGLHHDEALLRVDNTGCHGYR